MRKNISNSLIICGICITVLAGCKPKQVVVAPPPQAQVPVPDNKNERLEAIKGSQLEFNTLALKAKAALNLGGNSNDVSMNMRIRNNEAIWVSVTALAGLEVARALITPDSVKIINRLENVYVRKPFSYIHEFSNEKLTFSTLQSVLLGNLAEDLINPSTQLNPRGSGIALSTILGSLVYDVYVNSSNKVIRTSLKDNSRQQSLDVDYSGFQSVGSQIMANKVFLRSLANNKNFQLDLEFTKVELNVGVDMPFRVPERFTIKN